MEMRVAEVLLERAKLPFKTRNSGVQSIRVSKRITFWPSSESWSDYVDKVRGVGIDAMIEHTKNFLRKAKKTKEEPGGFLSLEQRQQENLAFLIKHLGEKLNTGFVKYQDLINKGFPRDESLRRINLGVQFSQLEFVKDGAFKKGENFIELPQNPMRARCLVNEYNTKKRRNRQDVLGTAKRSGIFGLRRNIKNR